MRVGSEHSPKISFYTVGCRLNQAETALLKDQFRRRGFVPVEYGQPTDILVVNSCTVTEGAESDCRRVVRQTLRQSPQAFVAVTGCYAQTGLAVLQDIEGIDLIVGNTFKMQLPEILPPVSQRQKHDRPLIQHARIAPEDFVLEGVGEYATTRANLKIQDGCQFMCAFCLIPFARGRERSRVLDDAVREAEALVTKGHKELVLTGVNIGQYRDHGRDILVLLERLEEIEGLSRIRISSIEPTTLPECLLEYMQDSTKLCRFLHVPMQSGDDWILRAMNRRYTRQAYQDAMESALKRVPDVCFGTDMMVGFPGEGEREFANTRACAHDLPFSYMHVFSYSPRPGTAAVKLPQAVPQEVIKKRSRELREISQRQRMVFYQGMMGKKMDVLIENQESEGYWMGLTDNFVRVAVGSEGSLENTMVSVRLTGMMADRAIGVVDEGQADVPQVPLRNQKRAPVSHEAFV